MNATPDNNTRSMLQPMKFGDRLKKAMDYMGWGPTDLGEKAKVGQATISALTSRGSDISKYKEDLISAFPADKVSHNWLRNEIGTMIPVAQPFQEAGKMPTATFVPVVGMAKMGIDGYYEEISVMCGAGDGVIETYSRDKQAYALKVRGDSMSPAIRDGWFVIVEPDSPATVGEYVLVKLKDGQRMVKELLYQREDSIAVMSVKGDVRHTIPNEDLDEYRGLQAVVGILPPSKWMPA